MKDFINRCFTISVNFVIVIFFSNIFPCWANNNSIPHSYTSETFVFVFEKWRMPFYGWLLNTNVIYFYSMVPPFLSTVIRDINDISRALSPTVILISLLYIYRSNAPRKRWGYFAWYSFQLKEEHEKCMDFSDKLKLFLTLLREWSEEFYSLFHQISWRNLSCGFLPELMLSKKWFRSANYIVCFSSLNN